LPIGYFLLGFTGPAIQQATIELSVLLPGRSALIMMLQTAAFDAGTIVFAFAKFLYVNSGITWKQFCLAYMCVPVMTCLSALLFWRGWREPEPEPCIEVETETTKISKTETKELSFGQMVMNRKFLYLALFGSVHILKLNFFVSNVNGMVEEKAEHPTQLQDIFHIILPFGFVVIPLGSMLLRSSIRGFFTLVNVTALIYSAAAVAMSLWGSDLVFYLQTFVAFPLVSVSRQLVYSGIFYSLSDSFGFTHFGKLLGTINIAVAIFSCMQFGLVEMSQTEGSFKWPNAILLLLVLPTLFPPKTQAAKETKETVTNVDLEAELEKGVA